MFKCEGMYSLRKMDNANSFFSFLYFIYINNSMSLFLFAKQKKRGNCEEPNNN